MEKKEITLGEFITQNQGLLPNSTGDLSKLLSSIKLAAKKVHHVINRAGMERIFGLTGYENIQGEEQTRLDILANEIFVSSLKSRGEVCAIASEEMEDFMVFKDLLHKGSKYIVLLDPLDGSKNIDVNVSVGTIFSIYKRLDPDTTTSLKDFIQKGRMQVAAGYILYGSSTMLVLTCGNGVDGFTLDPNIGSFFLTHPNIRIPETGNMYSINEGNYARFSKGVKKLLKHYQEVDSSQNRPFTSRYIGTLVSDFHRNMLSGGIYLYPKGTLNPKGKLRLLYECNPMAFIAEQAGGLAINGKENILDIKPDALHQRVPFFVGSKKLVEEVKMFIENE